METFLSIRTFVSFLYDDSGTSFVSECLDGMMTVRAGRPFLYGVGVSNRVSVWEREVGTRSIGDSMKSFL